MTRYICDCYCHYIAGRVKSDSIRNMNTVGITKIYACED